MSLTEHFDCRTGAGVVLSAAGRVTDDSHTGEANERADNGSNFECVFFQTCRGHRQRVMVDDLLLEAPAIIWHPQPICRTDAAGHYQRHRSLGSARYGKPLGHRHNGVIPEGESPSPRAPLNPERPASQQHQHDRGLYEPTALET